MEALQQPLRPSKLATQMSSSWRPQEWVVGNSSFTAGAMCTVRGGLQKLLPLVQSVTSEQAEKIGLERYEAVDDFVSNIMRLGDN